jgi:thiamine biosynthesis lipoprotein
MGSIVMANQNCKLQKRERVQVKKMTSIVIAMVIMVTVTACRAGQVPMVSRTSFMLDTILTISIYDWTDEETLTKTMEEISRLESLLSVEKEGSDLARLAEAAGKDWVAIAPETEELLKRAKEFWQLSEGHFDVTAGPLIDLWNIRNGSGHYPTEEELDLTLPLISSEKLQIRTGYAFLQDAGMKANLGAIAKGYIADKVKEFLLNEGVEHASIDLGRNLLFIGGKPDGSYFRVGVQSPLDERGELAKILLVSEKSVVTAGINERFFAYQGVNYHHILDPKTGFSADTGVASVTIISDESAVGDALSTTCLLLGEEKGLALVETRPEVEAMFIMKDGQEHMSSGFRTYVELAQ